MKLFKNIKRAVLIFLMVGSLLLPTLGFSFDKAPSLPLPVLPEFVNQYVDLSDVITQIHVFGTAEGFRFDIVDGKVVSVRSVGVFGQSGSCFYMGYHGGKHLFVTNAHVVTPTHVTIQETKNVQYITRLIKIISMIITIGQGTGLGSVPAEIVYVDEEYDLAIVSVVGNWRALGKQPYQATWTYGQGYSLLQEGDLVCTIVAQRPNIDEGDLSKGSWFEVRWGKVIYNHPAFPKNVMGEEWMIAWFNLNDNTSDLVIYPGDSGSPILAFENGKPYIVGVARAAGVFMLKDGSTEYYSYFTRIDPIIPFFLEK